MSVREKDSPELFAKVQEQNLLRQYDLLLSCIEIGFTKGIEAFDKYTLWSLNAVAVANIAQFGGVTVKALFTLEITGHRISETFPIKWTASSRSFMKTGRS